MGCKSVMQRLSIKGQVIAGVVLIGLLSLLCTVLTFFVIANTAYHSHPVETTGKGQFVGAVRFDLRPSIAALTSYPTWLINGFIVLLILTPFLYIGLFTYLFAWRFSKGISSPIKTLVQAVRKIQAHELDFSIDYQGNNEIGQLLSAFEEMRLDLKNSLIRQWSLEDERREMLAAISHDLRTPVTLLQGHAEMLLETPGLPDSANKSAETILRNSARIVRLLTDFRTLTDIESPQFTLSPVPVDPVSFFKKKLSEYETMAAGQSIELKNTVVDERTVVGEASMDVDRLAQVTDNLMANALRHTPQDGTVAWTIHVKDGEVTVCVQDSGSGFPPNELAKVFRKFYRGDTSRGQASGHAGLGLYIVKELIERQGGRVTAGNDAVTGGAVVEFHLPLVSAPAAENQS